MEGGQPQQWEWRRLTSMPVAHSEMLCRETTSLLLMDFFGHGWTQFHSDRSEAWNIVFLVLVGRLSAAAKAAALAAPCAEWVLFHPSVASEASQLWQDVGGGAKGFNTPKGMNKKVSSWGRCSLRPLPLATSQVGGHHATRTCIAHSVFSTPPHTCRTNGTRLWSAPAPNLAPK